MKTQWVKLAVRSTCLLTAGAALSLIQTGIATAAPGDALKRLQEQAAITRKRGDDQPYYERQDAVVATHNRFESTLQRLQFQASITRKEDHEAPLTPEPPQYAATASSL
jgi:hypothetical protein